MPVVISLLRGVNVGGHHKIKMADLRALYESLGLQHPQTYVQSGNVVFATKERDLSKLAKRIEGGIERRFAFRPDVILRTASELRDVIAKNPFALRRGIEPSKLVVTFLAGALDREIKGKLLQIEADPEDLRVGRRELYIYFPNGMGRSKLPVVLGKTLKKSGTSRNWNSVMNLLEMAEELEGRQ